MKKRLYILLLILVFSILSLYLPSCIAEPELKADIFGASMLIGLQRVGCIIYNSGTEPIVDISYTFSIIGKNNPSIDYTQTQTIESLSNTQSYTMSTNEINGYGPVTIQITATSSNAGEITETRTGFQIGPYTLCQPYLISWV